MIDEIRPIIAAILEVPESQVGEETDFVGELDADSLMALEILATLEKKYRVKIPESSLSKMNNLKNVVQVVEDMLVCKD